MNDNPDNPSPNKVEQLIDQLQLDRNIEQLEQELEKIKSDDLSVQEQETWWHFYGIAAFRNNRNKEALERFIEANKLFPDSVNISFSLGQQYVLAKEIEKGFSLFDKCLYPQVPSTYIMMQARYAYLWDQYERGIAYLNSIYPVYLSVKILDSTFLYMRGIPLFEHWWTFMASFSLLTSNWTELEKMTEEASKVCHDFDFDDLNFEIDVLKNNNLLAVVESKEKHLQNVTEDHAPSGYSRLVLAIAKSRLSDDYDYAKKLIDDVEFASNDYPWLDDMRLLAKIELNSRFDKAELSQLQDDFFDKQPLLFEPHIVTNFHLLEAQEPLKKLFQNKS